MNESRSNRIPIQIDKYEGSFLYRERFSYLGRYRDFVRFGRGIIDFEFKWSHNRLAKPAVYLCLLAADLNDLFAFHSGIHSAR